MLRLRVILYVILVWPPVALETILIIITGLYMLTVQNLLGLRDDQVTRSK